MTITRADVADLQPGDVVEIRHVDFPDVVTRGPLHRVADGTDSLGLGYSVIRYASGGVPHNADRLSLTVVSRAPRPLYVNSARTEPVPGDVVRDEDGNKPVIWMYAPVTGSGDDDWVPSPMSETHNHRRDELPARLRLLVDGESGLPPAVQS